MPLPIPKFIKTAFANIGLRNNIPEITNNTTGAAGYDRGFGEINMLPEGAGGIPPDGKDFNGVFYDLSAAIQYAQSGVSFPFNQDYATAIGGYEVGAIVSDASNKSLLWINGTASNTAFPTGWVQFSLKQATESVLGLSRIATSAEIVAGVNAEKIVTPLNLAIARQLSIGQNQTWQDVTASRALATVYTNTTGRSIKVSVFAFSGVSSIFSLSISIGSMVVGRSQIDIDPSVPKSSRQVTVSEIIPSGATYSIESSTTMGSITWMELR